jgi:hypothetical protein
MQALVILKHLFHFQKIFFHLFLLCFFYEIGMFFELIDSPLENWSFFNFAIKLLLSLFDFFSAEIIWNLRKKGQCKCLTETCLILMPNAYWYWNLHKQQIFTWIWSIALNKKKVITCTHDRFFIYCVNCIKTHPYFLSGRIKGRENVF